MTIQQAMNIHVNSQPNDKITFFVWLGFRKRPLFENAMWLGPIVGFILSLVGIVFLIAAIAMLYDLMQAIFKTGPYIDDTKGEAIRNIGLVLAALFGAPFIIWRTMLAAKQARIADEALFNEKINVAAQNLLARREITRNIVSDGSEIILTEVEDDLVARAAAIDRLEGLAFERRDTAPRISRLLAAYIRGNFPCSNIEPTENIQTRRTPRLDLQKAVDSISKVYELAVSVDASPWRLDLKECDFDGVSFLGGYFRAVDFTGSRFEGAILNKGNFEGTLFRRALLNYADCYHSNFRGAKFDRAVINRPEPVNGGLVTSINMGDLTGATFVAADISALDFLGSEEDISKTFGTADTIVSAQVRRRMPPHDLQRRAHIIRNASARRELSEQDLAILQQVEETGFQNWFPHDSSDGAAGWALNKFMQELKMDRWPFQD